MEQRGHTHRLPVNYSIKNIIASILSDVPAARRFSADRKRRLYRSALRSLEDYPRLQALLNARRIRAYPFDGSRFFARVAVLPPELVVVDERFQNLCCLPYWTVYSDGKGHAYRRFDRCPGYGKLPGCPPKARPVAEVKKLLDRSTHVIVLQTKRLQERWRVKWKFDVLHRLGREIDEVCGSGTVTGVFGSGPCAACNAQYCLYGRPCKTPALRTASLEACGICVARLCDDLALLTGDRAWKLTWLRHFGLPQQRPKTWKYVEAIAIRLGSDLTESGNGGLPL